MFNPGKVRVTYQIDQIIASIGGHTVDTPKFETTSGVVHPDEETIFFFPLIPSPKPIQAPAEGEISVTISNRHLLHGKQMDPIKRLRRHRGELLTFLGP